MPIIKSAKKRVRVTRKATVRNSKTKRSLRTAMKAFHTALTGGDKKATATTQIDAQSNIDKAAKKGIIHKNKAARQKSQLAAKAKAAGIAVAPTDKKSAKPPVKTVKPTAVKKAAPKAEKVVKATAKPAAAKKAVAKPTAKKAPAKK